MSKSPTTSVSEASSLQLAPRTKSTIGVIGVSPLKVAELNQKIVEYGGALGFLDDQDHPDLLAVGIPISQGKNNLRDAANLCEDFGCDVIAIPGSASEADLAYITNNKAFASDDLDQLAKQVVDYAVSLAAAKRPSLTHKNNGNDDHLVYRNLREDEEARQARMEARKEQNGYPLLTQHQTVGVLGGAGPMASAVMCQRLAERGVPFIHCSDNSAPGKHPFEMGVGPHYAPHYANIMQFFQAIEVSAIAIPCNTAHARLAEYCPPKLREKIIDIRESVLSQNKDFDRAILLGTSRTVGLIPNTKGIYEEYRAEHFANEISSFVIPTLKQQEKIIGAIYDIKKGKEYFGSARDNIMSTIQELRAIDGNADLPVIFVCTELALACSDLKLVNENISDSLMCLAQAAQTRLLKSYSAPKVNDESRFADTSTGPSELSEDEPEYSETKNLGSNSLEQGNIKSLLQKVEIIAWKSESGNIRITMQSKDATTSLAALRKFGDELNKLCKNPDSTTDRVIATQYKPPAITASFHKPLNPKLSEWIETNNISQKDGNPNQKQAGRSV